jgi:hypothetical protein
VCPAEGTNLRQYFRRSARLKSHILRRPSTFSQVAGRRFETSRGTNLRQISAGNRVEGQYNFPRFISSCHADP